MKSTPRRKLMAIAAAVIVSLSEIASATLPIDLEIAADTAAPPGSMQEWGRILATMDLARLRLRGRGRGDEPKVTFTGEGENKRYHVVGLLNRRDELVLPGGRFTHGDVAELKQFLQDFAERTEEAGVERGMFGLTKPQFEQLFKELSAVVATSTKDRPVASVIAELNQAVTPPLTIDAAAEAAIKAAPPLAFELKGMSTGTALAISLRSAGLGVIPTAPRGQPLAMSVVRLAPDRLVWPVGWKPEALPSRAAPTMYQSRVIEIEHFTLDKALAALEPVLGVPVFLDQHAMAAAGIDPAKVQVKFPRGKTFIRRAVDRILSQAKLQGEVRVDEAGRVFYWASQFGPESPRATK